jgi:predicted transcriptional regulator
MPDGKRYFWIARTIARGGYGHHAPRAEFAIALGCELRHAHRLVHAEGIALDDPLAATQRPTAGDAPRDSSLPERRKRY